MWSKSNNPYYPDTLIFLIVIPFIAAFNYYLTYPEPTWGWYLFITFLLDTIQGYLAVLFVRWIILWLDQKLPFEGQDAKRIVIQVIVTTIAGLLLISALTELVSFIVKGRSAHPSFYSHDLFIISIWFFVVNGIYIVLHYHRSWNQSKLIVEQKEQLHKSGFLVHLGNKEFKLRFDEIIGFYIDDENIVCLGIDKKRYFVNQSLNDLEETLPRQYFFRLNRQFILNYQTINGYKRMENGKLQVILHEIEHLPREISVSRTKAPAFKTWFQPRSNDTSQA